MKPLVAVTGASSGIGEAIAHRFSHAGHHLLLMARRVGRLETSRLPDAMCEAVDVTDSDSLRDAIAKGESRFGPVDCLVNNAGTMMLGQIDAQDRAEWERMYAVNVLALLDGMASVLGSMRKRRSGTIVNIGSTSGHTVFSWRDTRSIDRLSMDHHRTAVWPRTPVHTQTITRSHG